VLVLILNFLTGQNLQFTEITSVKRVTIFGGEAFSVAQGVLNPWYGLGIFSSMLLIIFVVDASVTIWRRAGTADRRRAVIVGGSITAFFLTAHIHSGLVHAGIIDSPYMISFAFMAIVAAMGHELSHDVLRAAELTRELQAREAQLRDSERKLGLAADAANLGMWEWDIARDEVWSTQSGRALFGFTGPDRITFKRFLDVLHPEDREQVRQSVMKSIEGGGDYESEYRVVLADGETSWIAARGRVEYNAQKEPVRMRGVSLDITERRRAEEALRESEARFRAMANTAPVMIWMSGTDKLCTFFNKGWLDFTGRTMEQELGNGWADGVHRDDLDRCLEVYVNSFDARREFTMEYRLRRDDGEYGWVLDTGVPRFAPDGTFLGYIGSAIDITELKRTEEALRKSDETARAFLESAAEGIVIVNRDGRIVVANAKIEELFGYHRDDLLGQFVEVLLPERIRPAHIKHRAAYFAGPRVRPMGVGIDLAGRRKDGTEFPVEISLSYVETEDGTLAMAFITDITERKQTEDTLRESEEKYRVVAETASDAIITIDEESRIVYANPNAEKVFGYAVEELLGQPLTILMPESLRARHLAALKKFCDTGQRSIAWKGKEFMGLHRSGRELPIEISFGAMRQQDDRYIFTGIVRDITERKRAEEALRDLTGRLIGAQEEERRRIARELHDDLTQRLAVLAIEVGSLEKQMGSSRSPVPERLRTMRDQIVKLSADVHGIARQLHPSILDDLGLVKAIESECSNFSHREGIRVGFETKDVPAALPRDIALCVYRVTQESLRNIAKHARCKDAHVSLVGTDGEILLSIEDAGVGFDVAELLGRAGLGLASMEERVRLIRGRLSIRSGPGKGTIIEVRAPVAGGDR
jgi:PAS domain S-box-containing protein